MRVINAHELKGRLEQKENFALINVLDREDFYKTHIEHSINIPFSDEDFMNQVNALIADRDHPIVVYCASNECASAEESALALDNEGYTNVANFKGGIEEWRDVGFSLEHPKKAWSFAPPGLPPDPSTNR